MPKKTPEELLEACSEWWDTSIIDIHPGQIDIRGYPVEQLIGKVRFPEIIWLMLRGELPTRAETDLLEAALVPGVDHGPHAPSIAVACMAVSCGLPVNGAMASAINVLDDVHGGAGQQCMELYREIDAEAGASGDLVPAATRVIQRHREAGEKIVPGFRGARPSSSSSRRRRRAARYPVATPRSVAPWSKRSAASRASTSR